MVTFPNCKINIGLHILGKREDGYHELETIFYPIPVKDGLEIIADSSLPETVFSQSGYKISGNPADNLCLKAYRMLQQDFPQISACRIHLHKVIPDRAGLGGGSSDAAFTLHLLNDIFQLQLNDQLLMQYALQLGSDCPFFVKNKPCLAGGRGEKLSPVAVDLSQYSMLLIHPGIGIETARAFAGLKLTGEPRTSLAALITLPIDAWKENMVNDFEKSIFPSYPEIAAIKTKMYEHGAVYASMSGSGSSVYGIFSNKMEIPFPEHYFQKWF